MMGIIAVLNFVQPRLHWPQSWLCRAQRRISLNEIKAKGMAKHARAVEAVMKSTSVSYPAIRAVFAQQCAKG
jgi:hypothetical protein